MPHYLFILSARVWRKSCRKLGRSIVFFCAGAVEHTALDHAVAGAKHAQQTPASVLPKNFSIFLSCQPGYTSSRHIHVYGTRFSSLFLQFLFFLSQPDSCDLAYHYFFIQGLHLTQNCVSLTNT